MPMEAAMEFEGLEHTCTVPEERKLIYKGAIITYFFFHPFSPHSPPHSPLHSPLICSSSSSHLLLILSWSSPALLPCSTHSAWGGGLGADELNLCNWVHGGLMVFKTTFMVGRPLVWRWQCMSFIAGWPPLSLVPNTLTYTIEWLLIQLSGLYTFEWPIIPLSGLSYN